MALPQSILNNCYIIILPVIFCSSDSNLLVIPKTTTVNYSERSFTETAPKLWNQLTLAIKQSNSVVSFKKALKMYLFHEHFLLVVKSIETFICRMRF